MQLDPSWSRSASADINQFFACTNILEILNIAPAAAAATARSNVLGSYVMWIVDRRDTELKMSRCFAYWRYLVIGLVSSASWSSAPCRPSSKSTINRTFRCRKKAFTVQFGRRWINRAQKLTAPLKEQQKTIQNNNNQNPVPRFDQTKSGIRLPRFERQ